MYRQPHDQTFSAILLLVEVSEPFVCSHELDFSEIFIVLLVTYFYLCLSVMLEFCGICTRHGL